MIEKVVYDFLKEKGIPVYMETPDTPPKTFVLVKKTGSGRYNLINSAMIIIQSYAPSLYKASELNESIKTLLLGTDDEAGLKERNEVFGISLNSDYEFTDTETKKYRYQAVFDITF